LNAPSRRQESNHAQSLVVFVSLFIVRCTDPVSTVYYIWLLKRPHVRFVSELCRLVYYSLTISIVTFLSFVEAKRILLQKLKLNICDKRNLQSHSMIIESYRDIIISHKCSLSDRHREWRHSRKVYSQTRRKSWPDAMDHFLQGNYTFTVNT